MTEGWIKLHRKVMCHELYKEPRRYSKFEAWIYILLHAYHTDCPVNYKGMEITIHRGSFITTVDKLAAEWQWDRKTVMRYLRALEVNNMVWVRTLHGTVNGTMNGTVKGTVLSVVNWDLYQYTGTVNDTVEGTAINKNDSKKNKKEESYMADFETFWRLYPRKIDKPRAYAQWKARLNKGITVDTLLTATKGYITYLQEHNTDPQYIQHPKTFLGPNTDFEQWINYKPKSPVNGINPETGMPYRPGERPPMQVDPI